ncbi:MAG: hypothetical protein R3E18_03230 [Sphingomonadaceae bacterium]|nr:hypothetical protein [Sphingomonadaceae bacterium]
MIQQSVFLVYCELLSDSAPLRKEGYAGAFVTCIIATEDIVEAVQSAKKMLAEDGYSIADIDKVVRFEPEEWEHDTEICSIVSDVLADREPRYSDFAVWGH